MWPRHYASLPKNLRCKRVAPPSSMRTRRRMSRVSGPVPLARFIEDDQCPICDLTGEHYALSPKQRATHAIPGSLRYSRLRACALSLFILADGPSPVFPEQELISHTYIRSCAPTYFPSFFFRHQYPHRDPFLPCLTPSLMPHSSIRDTTSNDKSKLPLDLESKSLTPQRKHRKLMKDGSSEVWPENVEKIFVKGLKQYWESPWATYSRGRSRWRNQFLVDYLQKAGIDRSKKQVASHIQVLRNMWKGEPEFHLVAGGEELFLESGLLAPVKSEEHSDANALVSAGYDESSSVGDASSSPNFPPLAFQFDECFQFSSPTQSQPTSRSTTVESYFSGSNMAPTREQSQLRSCSLERAEALGKLETLNLVYPPSPLSTASSSSRHSHDHPAVSSSSRAVHMGSVSVESSPRSPTPFTTLSAPSSPPKRLKIDPVAVNHNVSIGVPFGPSSARSSSAGPPVNSLSSISLWAEGMLPFTVQVDSLRSSSSPNSRSPARMSLRIRLYLSSIDDIHSPPTLHGFHGTVSFAAPWISSAQCITTVYTTSGCISEEVAPLQLSNIPGDPTQAVTAFLPESSLSRSRWLDATLQTTITQQVMVDDHQLAVIMYDLDRSIGGSAPSAELISLQKEKNYAPAVISSPLTYSTPNHAPRMQPIPLPRSTEHTSLSCALTPISIRSSNTGAAYGARPPHFTSSILF